MNVAKVVLIEGKSQFSSLNQMLFDLKHSLFLANIEVKVIDIQASFVPSNNDIAQIKAWQPDLMISFCPYGLYFMPDRKKWLWEYFNCPYICWLVDSVITYFIQLFPAFNSGSLILACVDTDNYTWLQKYFPFLKSMYLPHAVNLSEDSLIFSAGESDMDISLLSSIGDMHELALDNFKEELSADIFNLLQVTVAILKDNPQAFIWDVVIQNFVSVTKRKFEFKADIGNVMRVFFIAEQFLRTYKKVVLVNTLNEFVLDIFGNDKWEAYQGNFHYHGRVDCKQAFKVFSRSKLTLNSQPPQIISGMHERIFRAILSGAVVVAEETSALKDNFVSGEEIVLFDQGNIEAIIPTILHLLLNSESRAKMVVKAKKNVLKNHTMKNRVEAILEYLSKM